MSSADPQTSPTHYRVALGVSGGIAAYKAVEVLRGLQKAGCSVRVAMTRRACEFVQPLTFRALSGAHVIVDDYAPDNPDPIAHITFSQTIDLLVVAPATANIIAKFSNGVADDFLTSTYLACTAPVLIAPAMNTAMWEHPATQRNLQQLRSDGLYVLDPDAGEMACGTIGPGRLSDPERIVSFALEILRRSRPVDLSSERIVITAGATREAIDPVRFISNRSSGKMGFALAQAAQARGAKVIVIAGPTSADPPSSLSIRRVVSAEEMAEAVAKEIGTSTMFIGAAAVADYRPVKVAGQKIKKKEEFLTLELERTADILAKVSNDRPEGMLVVGFAAETDNVVANAESKLRSKLLDVVVANDISNPEIGFDSENNEVTILARGNTHPIKVPLCSKLEVANRILDVVANLRSPKASGRASG